MVGSCLANACAALHTAYPAPSLRGVATTLRRSCLTPGPTPRYSRETLNASDSIWALWTESFFRMDTGITAAPCSAHWR